MMESQEDDMKEQSVTKKSNGIDCNGMSEHSVAADGPTEAKSPVSSNGAKTAKLNGYRDRSEDDTLAERDLDSEVKDMHSESTKGIHDAGSESDVNTGNKEDATEKDVRHKDCEQSNHGDEGKKSEEQTGAEMTSHEGKSDTDKCVNDDNKTENSVAEKAPVKTSEAPQEKKADESKSLDGHDKSKKSSYLIAPDKVASSDTVDNIQDQPVDFSRKVDVNKAESDTQASENDIGQRETKEKTDAHILNLSRPGGDEVEIIGESRPQPSQNQSVVYVRSNMTTQSQSLPFHQNFTTSFFNGTSLLTGASVQNTLLLQNMQTNFPGTMNPSRLSNSLYPGQSAQGISGISMYGGNPSAPPTPKSSMDQIELIRWEIQNRINVRPKYFKPNASSELGPLAKFLFDIGLDLIKESVYHDLVSIQSKKNNDDKLNEKERDDLEKLKEIEKDLYATIGHLKLRFKKRCNDCGFQTESNNVLFFHKQFPHEDVKKKLHCSYCPFRTKQSLVYKTHMETEHGIQGKLYDKKGLFECHMCPYENNQEPKLVLHRERCLKQFRPLFNLHPSCLSGAEINLCLENIFYKPVIPKNLKLLQQKHAQQQAALAEAKRQQAQMQMIAAQKNAAALQAKRQQQQLLQQRQQLQKQRLPNIVPRFNSPLNLPTQAVPRARTPTQPQQSTRFNSKANRPTVANMLNNRANANANALPPQSSPSGGFEVCEICGGYVKDRKALRIHFFYAHRIDLPFNLFERNQAPLYCATCYVRFWTAQGLRKHIDTHKEENQTRGVVGKCISCGHQVLNLLLHMRVVHNRELQHYINALMCMFCGGHFSSRTDCERHIIKTHGNVDPATGTVKSPPAHHKDPPSQPTPAKSSHSNKKSSSSKASNLVKGSVCVLCNLNFGRNVDLTRHCMRMHHTCMKCGMVVIDKASLLKHTCLTSPSGTRDCGMCGETGFHPAYYVKHLRDKHLRKFSIKVAKVSKSVIERWTKRPCPFEDQQEVLVEIIDSDDESSTAVSSKDSRQNAESSKIPFSPPKKPKIGPACSKVKKRAEPTKKKRIGPASKIGRRPLIVNEGNDDQGECGNDKLKEHGEANENVNNIESNEQAKDVVLVNDNGENYVDQNEKASMDRDTEEKVKKEGNDSAMESDSRARRAEKRRSSVTDSSDVQKKRKKSDAEVV